MKKTLTLTAIVSGFKKPDTGRTVIIKNTSDVLIATATESPVNSGQYVVDYTPTQSYGYWYVDGIQKAEANNAPFYLGTPSDAIQNYQTSSMSVLSASFAVSASYSKTGTVATASWAQSASVALWARSSSYASKSSNADSAGSALSASYLISPANQDLVILKELQANTRLVVSGTSQFNGNIALSGSSNILSSSLSSPIFMSGFAGSGMRIDNGVTEANKTSAEVDNLTVRGKMNVYELMIHQIRATNGSLWISSTGKVQTVTDAGSNYYVLTFDTGSSDAEIGHGFVPNDLIRAQRWNAKSSSIIVSDMRVTAVTDTRELTALLLNSTNVPVAGYEYVRVGNTTDTTRQGAVYLTSDDSNAPFIDVIDGVTAHSEINTTGKIKTRVGKLTGITSGRFGALNGSGFWASGSAYLEGSINASEGSIANFSITPGAISSSNNNVKLYSSGLISCSVAWIGGWNISDPVQYKIFNTDHRLVLSTNTNEESLYFVDETPATNAIKWCGIGKLYNGTSWTTEEGFGLLRWNGSSYVKDMWISNLSKSITNLTVKSADTGDRIEINSSDNSMYFYSASHVDPVVKIGTPVIGQVGGVEIDEGQVCVFNNNPDSYCVGVAAGTQTSGETIGYWASIGSEGADTNYGVKVQVYDAGTNYSFFGMSGKLHNSHSISTNQSVTSSGVLTESDLIIDKTTSPIHLKGGTDRGGAYSKTVVYCAQNNTTKDNANGIFIERGRLSDSSGAEVSKFTIGSRGGQVQMFLDATGSMSIAGTLTQNYSDMRLKNYIAPILNPLNIINSLEGFTFTWNDVLEDGRSGSESVGMSAQDVEKVYPYAATTNIGGWKAIQYDKFVPLFVEAFKEMQKKIDTLEDRIRILEGKQNGFENKD
jgi:hypothetical protein